jgi:hypothetical protein
MIKIPWWLAKIECWCERSLDYAEVMWCGTMHTIVGGQARARIQQINQSRVPRGVIEWGEKQITMTDRLKRKQSSIRLVGGTLFVLLLVAATTLVAPLFYDIEHCFLTACRNWFLRSSPQYIIRKSSTGVSFQRTISNFPSNSTFWLTFRDKKCQDSDSFGDNHCHYDWGDYVSADYSIFVNETLTEAAFVKGTFKVSQSVNKEGSIVVVRS